MMSKPKTISKELSKNDTGETGAHQAGMLIPHGGDVLAFFPRLNVDQKNPRTEMCFSDSTGKLWKFNFIYYNNKFFGGTRNEFRLTGMTYYFKSNNLKSGDIIALSHEDIESDTITFQRHAELRMRESVDEKYMLRNRIVLGTNWKVINY